MSSPAPGAASGKVLYDVRQEAPPVGGSVRGGLLGALVGVLLLAVVWQRRDRAARLFAVAWILGCLGLFGWKAVAVARAHREAAGWAVSGRAASVEGVVRDFSAAHESPAGIETFRVGDVLFRVTGDPLKVPGLNRPSGAEGPVREGARVRILYHGESILRVEELAPPPPKG
ncbi:MAG: hypothetical protein EDX89_08765 [Acidobacteria bacterium]|nr:MAG: hypothetical protein EDX89_08765 [Acidobacteriota bacterium]